MKHSIQNDEEAGNLRNGGSPDRRAYGLIGTPVVAARYYYQSFDPDDVAMKVAGLVPKGARVLDIGYGTVAISAVVAAMRGAEVVGIESGHDRVKIAREKGIQVHEGYISEDLRVRSADSILGW